MTWFTNLWKRFCDADIRLGPSIKYVSTFRGGRVKNWESDYGYIAVKMCWHGGGGVKNNEKSADVLYGRPLPFARSCVWKSAKGSIGCCLHYYTTTKTHIWECRVLNIWFLSPFVPSKILICLRAIYVYFYKRKYFVKVNIDGSVLKNIQTETN